MVLAGKWHDRCGYRRKLRLESLYVVHCMMMMIVMCCVDCLNVGSDDSSFFGILTESNGIKRGVGGIEGGRIESQTESNIE